jgi:GntR family transcriptional regulator
MLGTVAVGPSGSPAPPVTCLGCLLLSPTIATATSSLRSTTRRRPSSTRANPRPRDGGGTRARLVASRFAEARLTASPLLWGCRMTVDKGDSESAVPRQVSPIAFRLDLASGVPTYLQLVHQVEHALRLGYLVPGDQLPKVRDVVAELVINPNTVLKAYRELETKGLTVGRPGQGTFIEATLNQVALPELTELRRSLISWVAAADAAGLDEDGIAALVANVLRDLRERRGGSGNHPGAASGRSEGVA